MHSFHIKRVIYYQLWQNVTCKTTKWKKHQLKKPRLRIAIQHFAWFYKKITTVLWLFSLNTVSTLSHKHHILEKNMEKKNVIFIARESLHELKQNHIWKIRAESSHNNYQTVNLKRLGSKILPYWETQLCKENKISSKYLMTLSGRVPIQMLFNSYLLQTK